MEGMRLRLRAGVDPEAVGKLVRGIGHQRFRKLGEEVLGDLKKAGFRSLGLGLYLRLGGWSHTGGTYVNAMVEVAALCRELFGYEIPEKIGSNSLRDYRYRTGKGLAGVWPKIEIYHQKRVTK